MRRRLEAAHRWAVLARSAHHDSVAEAYTLTLNQLDLYVSVFAAPTAKHCTQLASDTLAHQVCDLSVDAANYAVESERLEIAVEFPEQGWSVILTKMS